jgi:hypothetical protein
MEGSNQGWKSTWDRLEEAGIPIVPVEKLAEDPVLKRLAGAGIVYGVDIHTHLGAVFFGDNCAPIALDPGTTVAFSLDFDSNDVDHLVAATRRLKGGCALRDE